MAIQVSLSGKVKEVGLFNKSSPKIETLLEKVRKLPSQAKALEQWFTAEQIDSQILIVLYPLSDPICIKYDECSRKIEMLASTSVAGPGYHALITDYFLYLINLLGIEDPCIFDETNYFQHQDFNILKTQYAGWIQSIISKLLTDKEEHFAISMPNGYFVSEGFYAVLPLGPKTKVECEKFDSCPKEDLFKIAGELFPWWDKDLDAQFWLKTAKGIMWVDIPWHKPINTAEETIYNHALSSLETAYKLDKTLTFPLKEWREMAELVSKKVPFDNSVSQAKENSDSIGYRRRTLLYYPFGKWIVEIPGYFYEELTDEGKAINYWHENISIQFSSITAKSKNTKEKCNPLPDIPQGEGDIIRINEERRLGWGRHKKNVIPNDDLSMFFEGYVAFQEQDKDEVAVISINYHLSSIKKEFVEKIFRSVRKLEFTE